MSNKLTALIVEDERNILSFMSAILTANEFKVVTARSAGDALTLIGSHCPGIVILDLGLPDMDGMEVIRRVRAWSKTPILVVSARDREQDKVDALDLGADDYITKPFGTQELLARIRAALRHKNAEAADAQGAFVCGDLRIDLYRRQITVAGESAHLTQIEYKIVELLTQNAGRVMTYDAMIRAVWGPNGEMDNQILRVNMANIRRKLEKNPANPRYITTEIGVGYRMADGVNER